MGIDKITLSVIQAGLQQVCDEMDLTFSLVQKHSTLSNLKQGEFCLMIQVNT